MRFLFVFVLLTIAGCNCDKPSYYQIKSVTPDVSLKWKCQYVAEGMSTCATWQRSPQIIFADSCGKFVLSQVVGSAQLNKYR
ncbi:MAG: hypothetical protein JST43_09205 [Bacteroidetes bacterium]|nr:hypothetical protein [Bacteroidota bacterium]MBS1539025.1 hypothetical protein [Bacteroidota bacterium]